MKEKPSKKAVTKSLKPSKESKKPVALKAKKEKAPQDNLGLSIDFQTKHMKFGANLVPTKIKAIDPRFIPKYHTEDAACADLVANINKDTPGAHFDGTPDVNKWVVQIPSRNLMKVDVGFEMQLPSGWQAEVSARSGWAKRGLIVTNGPGQIDEDYRGPISVLLGNVGKEIIYVKDGDRIGQIKPVPVFKFVWEEAESLDETERNDGGFGHTGGM